MHNLRAFLWATEFHCRFRRGATDFKQSCSTEESSGARDSPEHAPELSASTLNVRGLGLSVHAIQKYGNVALMGRYTRASGGVESSALESTTVPVH